jgi:hypothetical protein
MSKPIVVTPGEERSNDLIFQENCRDGSVTRLYNPIEHDLDDLLQRWPNAHHKFAFIIFVPDRQGFLLRPGENNLISLLTDDMAS